MVAKKDNPTNGDILGAISDFATYVEERFNSQEKRLVKMDALMVTKDYLDDKLSDLRGDLVVLMRKEDTKLSQLITLLTNKKVLSTAEQQQLATMEPFARP